MSIRLVLVDDHAMVRRGFRLILSQHPREFDVVGEAGEGPFERHHAHTDCYQQGHRGDNVVAEAAPDEGGHHQSDEAEGGCLLPCHSCIPSAFGP